MWNILFSRVFFRVLLITALLTLSIPVAATTFSLGSSGTSPPAIANGDSVILHGIATGHPRDGLQVWVIGRNYLRINSISVNADNTFEFKLSPVDTENLASGQYYVVVQHPMMNGQFDIIYDIPTGRVINRQLGGNGMGIYQMSGSGSLQGPDSAQALVHAINNQDVDDTFTEYTFTINPSSAFIDPIPDHAVGDRLVISGSTNLASGDTLMIEITSSSFKPTQKSANGEFSGTGGMVTIVPGSGGYNRWSFDVDTTSFAPDEYIVKVYGITVGVSGTTTFKIVDRLPVTYSLNVAPVQSLPLEVTTSTSPPIPSPTPPAIASLPIGIGVACLILVFSVKRIIW